jgi:hypothetical protein
MLTKSERVRLLQEVSRRLGSQSWQDIRLTLRQFGFPEDDEFPAGPDGYVLAMVENAPEEQQLELAAHLGIRLVEPREETVPECWKPPGYLRLFVSHISGEKEKATDLQSALLDLGIAAFVAHKDIKPTKEWRNEIERALKTADALVALLTPGFHESDWTDQEIGFAMGREILIVSVRYGRDPYGFIGVFQAVPGSDGPAAVATSLYEAMLSHPKTSLRMRDALVALFESTGSFKEARVRMSLLEAVEGDWTEAQLARIKEAVTSNPQISGADLGVGVPARAAVFLERERKALKTR